MLKFAFTSSFPPTGKYLKDEYMYKRLTRSLPNENTRIYFSSIAEDLQMGHKFLMDNHFRIQPTWKL